MRAPTTISPEELSALHLALAHEYQNLSNDEIYDLVADKLSELTERQAESALSALLQLVSNANVIRYITGFTENQRNGLDALEPTLGTEQFFGGEAADLALQAATNKDLDKIDEQYKSGSIGDRQRSRLTQAALRSVIGGGNDSSKPISTERIKKLICAAGVIKASVDVSRPGGENVEVNARPQDSEGSTNFDLL